MTQVTLPNSLNKFIRYT